MTTKFAKRASEIFAGEQAERQSGLQDLADASWSVFKKILLASAVLLFLLIFVRIQTAHAQDLGVGIYPPILQIDTTPPSSVKTNINVKNQTDQSATYNIYLEPFTAGGKFNGEPEFDSNLLKEYKNFFDKVQVFDGTHTIQNVTLAPKQQKTLTLHIGLPKGERPQDYYFTVLFVSAVGANNLQSSNSSARGGIGTNVLVSIGPKSGASGEITHFQTPGFQTSGPVKFSLLISNTGNSFFAPTGNILVKDMFGQVVGQINTLPVNILADSRRFIPSKDNPDKDNPKVVWNQKFLFGFYTATATLSLSDAGPVLHKSVTFFAFPVEGILGIVIAGLIVWGVFRRVKAKQKETT